MGISGLLPFIRDATEPVNVRKYKGQTVAVDAYCWLHKGAYCCAEKLAKGEPTDLYVTFCMKYVDMLLSFGVRPILVFDGRNLPSKEKVEKARQEHRQANLQLAKQCLREGKLPEARYYFNRCINVTQTMAHDVIKAARARAVDCVVAPYEADAQLAFLNRAGIAQAIITEDSDLLAFGCKKVILKMDKLGNGLEIDQKHLGRCLSLGDMFTEERFRYMCILTGCDYLPSLCGIGPSKACKLLRVARNPDILKVIRNMGQYLHMNIEVTDEYLEGFVKANNTFLYQLVFDPISRKVVPLNPYPDNIDPTSLSYAGHNMGDKVGLQMALGNLDINTMEVIDNYDPNTTQLAKVRSHSWADGKRKSCDVGPSIWSKNYIPMSPLSSQPLVCNSAEKSSQMRCEKAVSLEKQKLSARELQVKRPRQELVISEEDVLLQYSSPSPKMQRQAETLGQARPTSTAPQPRSRNRFATLLQRRNQENSLDDEGTQSRFFCSLGSRDTPCAAQGALAITDCPQDELKKGLPPTCKEPQAMEQQLAKFRNHSWADSKMKSCDLGPSQWSKNCTPMSPLSSQPLVCNSPEKSSQMRCEKVISLEKQKLSARELQLKRPRQEPVVSEESVLLQYSSPSPKVQRQTETPCQVRATCRESQTTEGRDIVAGSEASLGLPGSTHLQKFRHEAGVFCWANSCLEKPQVVLHMSDLLPVEKTQRAPPSSPHQEASDSNSPPTLSSAYFSQSGQLGVEKEQSPTQDPNTSQASSNSNDRKLTAIRAKLPGLPRVRTIDIGKAVKIQPSVPARASGLRKTANAKKSSQDSQKVDRIPSTLCSLWKNFSFKK